MKLKILFYIPKSLFASVFLVFISSCEKDSLNVNEQFSEDEIFMYKELENKASSQKDINDYPELFTGKSPWLLNNTNGTEKPRLESPSFISSLFVWEQGRFGVVNMDINYPFYNPIFQSRPCSGATTNMNGEYSSIFFDTPVFGVEVAEQYGYGIVDIGLIGLGKSGTIWATDNQNADRTKKFIAPAGNRIFGLSVREQSGYGIVDVRAHYKPFYPRLEEFSKLRYSSYIVGNQNGCSTGIRMVDKKVKGIAVREQSGYGIVNIAFLTENNRSAWANLNNNGTVKIVTFDDDEDYVKSIEIAEQDGFGIVDMRLTNQKREKTPWVTKNNNADRIKFYYSIDGEELRGFEAKEQWGYGLVDIRFIGGFNPGPPLPF